MEQHPFDEAFPDVKASRRSRALISLVIAAIVLAAVVVVLLLPSSSRCDGAAVRSFIADRSIPHAMIGEVCSFDEPLASGLRELAVAPPDRVRLLTLKALADSAALLGQVCPDGPRILAAAAELPPETQGAAFAERCDLAPLAPLSAGEIAAAGAERLALALVIHHVLVPTDPDAAVVLGRRIIRGH